MLLLSLYTLQENLRRNIIPRDALDIIRGACVDVAKRNDALGKILRHYSIDIPPVKMNLPTDLLSACTVLIEVLSKYPTIERFFYDACVSGLILRIPDVYALYNKMLNSSLNDIRACISNFE